MMGFRWYKSFKAGPVRVNLSRSGVGWSVGTKGLRYTKRANGKKRKRKQQESGGIGCLGWCVLGFAACCVVGVILEWIKAHTKLLAGIGIGFVVLVIAAIALLLYLRKKERAEIEALRLGHPKAPEEPKQTEAPAEEMPEDTTLDF